MRARADADDSVRSVSVNVREDGHMSVLLIGSFVAVNLEEYEVGKIMHALEARRIKGDGAVGSGEHVLRLALADALRTRGIDADEYAAGLAWLDARK